MLQDTTAELSATEVGGCVLSVPREGQALGRNVNHARVSATCSVPIIHDQAVLDSDGPIAGPNHYHPEGGNPSSPSSDKLP